MHPAMIEALAAEHRADLLRQAETYRRAVRSPRQPSRASALSRVGAAVQRLRRTAAGAVRPSTQACCA